MALFRTVGGEKLPLNPREYFSYGVNENNQLATGSYTSGTAININTSVYCPSFFINVKGITGTISATLGTSGYFTLIGINEQGATIIHSSTTAATTMSAKSFTKYDYLLISAGANGTPTLSVTINE